MAQDAHSESPLWSNNTDFKGQILSVAYQPALFAVEKCYYCYFPPCI